MQATMSFLSIIAVWAHLAFQMIPHIMAERCIVDYSHPCAEGWAPSTVYARVCDAPISYHGPCATSLPFAETSEDRKSLEKMCNITWPCYMDCTPDYDGTCPKFWYFANGLCMPSAAYHGRCEQPVDLKKMHKSERELWGNRCGVVWPCKTKCKRDYNAKCPEGWEHTGEGRCRAPNSYTGPCFTTADLSFANNKMKQEFENLCNVTFPCK